MFKFVASPTSKVFGIRSNPQQQQRISLQEIARLPVTERHKILAPFIAATAEDFLNDPELTEFAVLDGEDWEIDLTKEEL
ncbi:hypothetical protein VB620_15205 [Nodularia harveyana UHCC-0300]|uniref:Uncharacterized protein n=1 Tax=Nodularia harveyana UHCC-0300 TaxID=2974287 RepID=A0ABU5UGM7_9CYAN|nr:hypothetical protein [Nodularia harveyana]MEA5582686.1 hypothetical protein [Nodularia harveyana UHCC-0300]